MNILNLEALKRTHSAWVKSPNTSNGQREDSLTILSLIYEIEAFRHSFFTFRTQVQAALEKTEFNFPMKEEG